MSLRLCRALSLVGGLHTARVGLLVVAGGAALCGSGCSPYIVISCAQGQGSGQNSCAVFSGSPVTGTPNIPINLTVPVSAIPGLPGGLPGGLAQPIGPALVASPSLPGIEVNRR